MPKRFFLISQVFYPDQVSTAGLFTNLCEELAKNDVDPVVWCAQPSYDARKRQPSKVVYNGIHIHYLPSTNFSKNSKFGRICNYITFSLSLILKLLFSSNKTTIFTTTNPPFLGIIVAIISALKRQKFNYIIQDIFPDGLVRLNMIRNTSMIVRIWKKLNQFTIKKSNKIIVIGRDMLPWIESLDQKALTKTKYIPIWQDEELIQPTDYSLNPFVLENNLTKKFVVQYSGNMGLWNDMQTYAHVANELADENLHFVFIGDGVRKDDLTENIASGKEPYIHYLPFQPKDNLKNSITACHIALVSLNKGLEGMAVPSKIMGILAAGVPVVASVPLNSEIANIIRENDCGMIVPPGSAEECSQAISMLYQDDELRSHYGKNARNAFLKNFSTQIVAKEYLQLLA